MRKSGSWRVALGRTNTSFDPEEARTLSPNIAALGYVSMLTAMSSAMIYSLLPVFLVRALGIAVSSDGLIEGAAEAATSLVKFLSGAVSDRLGRRKPFVVFGYTLSALTKAIYPAAETWLTVFGARVVDRPGKGIRDAPRDAFLTDLTATPIRGAGFGLRLALGIVGFVAGPLVAVGLMKLSGDAFRLVFGIALIPAYLSIAVLLVAVKELPPDHDDREHGSDARFGDITGLPSSFWWVVAIAGLLSLARFSQAFLVLKANAVGIDAAFVPLALVVMHLVFALTAYPCGIFADRVDRRLQLGIGAAILVGTDLTLAAAATIWQTGLGAALWGLQLGVTQGLLGAAVADAAPDDARATAFGTYDIAVGIATFIASAGAGVLWSVGGAALAFEVSAGVAAVAALTLLVRPLQHTVPRCSLPYRASGTAWEGGGYRRARRRSARRA
jgi:MFS family permease